MAVRQRGDTWCVDFMVSRKRIREYGFTSEASAQIWEIEAKEALKAGKPLPLAPGDVRTAPRKAQLSTMQDLYDRLVTVRWSGQKSSKSQQNGQHFVQWVGPQVTVDKGLTTENVHAYVEELRDTNRAGGTINRRLAAVSSMSRLAVSLRLIEARPDIPRQRETEGRIRWFTEEEEAAIFATLAQWGKHRERDLFIFLVDTGARVGEARKLRWDDISPNDKAVTFWETKAGNSRSVPLTARAQAALKRRRGEDGTETGPFSRISQGTLNNSIWLRLREVHPWLSDAVIHTFRHTCASRLVQKGVDIMRVKVWMGHTAIQTTLRYAHLAPKHLDDVLRVLEGGRQ